MKIQFCFNQNANANGTHENKLVVENERNIKEDDNW